MAVARAHPLCSLVAFLPWIFPCCRVSKKAAGSESRTRKIHRNPRHWRSCSILTPPIEEPCTRENRARVRSLSLPRFSRLSRTHLSFSFSLILVLSFYLSAVATPPLPCFLLLLRPRILVRLHLGWLSSYLAPTSAFLLRRRRRRYHHRCVLSLLALFLYFHPALPALLFPRPASFLFFGVGFAGAADAPRTPPDVPSEMVSFPLPLPDAFVLPLATLCVTATWKKPRIRGEAAKPWMQRGKGAL